MKEALEKKLLAVGMRVRTNGDCGFANASYTGTIVAFSAKGHMDVCRDDRGSFHVGGGERCPKHPSKRAWQTYYDNAEAFVEILGKNRKVASPFSNVT